MLVKVDRVCSIVEVKSLIEAGIRCVGFSIGDTYKCDDSRIVDIAVVRQARELYGNEICICCDVTSSANVEKCDLELMNFIQVSANDCQANPSFVETIKTFPYKALVDLDIDYDEDPAWLGHRIRGIFQSWHFFQANLIPSVQNAWRFLLEESPQHPEEIQPEDIKKIFTENFGFLTCCCSRSDFVELANYFGRVAGFVFILGSRSKRNDVSIYEFSTMMEMIGGLNLEKQKALLQRFLLGGD